MHCGASGAPSAASEPDHRRGGVSSGYCCFGHSGCRGRHGDSVCVGVGGVGGGVHAALERCGVVLVVFFSVGLDEAPAVFVFGGWFGGGGGGGGRGLVGGVELFEAQDAPEPFGGFAHCWGWGVRRLRAVGWEWSKKVVVVMDLHLQLQERERSGKRE